MNTKLEDTNRLREKQNKKKIPVVTLTLVPRSEEVNITSLITTVTSLMTRKHSSAVAERVFKRCDAGVSCIPLTPAEESALG